MSVLKYNSYGEPLYWFNDYNLKTYKVINKNESLMIETPKRFEAKVNKLRKEAIKNRL